MIFLYAFIGFFIGGMVGEFAGALIGATAGWLFGLVKAQQKALSALRKRLDSMEGRLGRFQHRLEAPQPPAHTPKPKQSAGSLLPEPGSPEPGSSEPGETEPENTKAGNPGSRLEEGMEPPSSPTAKEAVSAAMGSNAPEFAAGLGSTPDSLPSSSTSSSPSTSHPRPRAREASSQSKTGIEAVLRYISDFFTGGNTVVRVGLVVLLVGVVLLLKYAIDHALFPIEMRMASAAAIGTALVGIGYVQRTRRREFGLSLQGGGVATIYLVVFFSFRIYGLLPASLAFGLLVALAIFSGIMAVTQNSLALIVIGVVGGFLAPVLSATDSGDHVFLFSYYLLLNLLIFGVAWFKVWRPLNLLGFVFTFGIGTAWGALSYEPEHFASTEPFLIAFFLLYVGIVVLFARRQQSNLRGWVDGSLTFGTPLAVLALQYPMVLDMPFGMAYSALGMAAVYIGVAAILWRKAPIAMRNLVEAFLALGIGFATLAVPYGLSNHSLTGATWAVEGLGLFWLGIRQSRLLSRVAGVLLQLAAGVALLYSQVARGYPHDGMPVLNSTYAAIVLIVVSALGIAYLGHKHQTRLTRTEAGLRLFIVWALVWWYPGSAHEIFVHVGIAYENAALLMLVTLTGLTMEWFGRKRDWIWGRLPALLSILAVLVLMSLYRPGNVLINYETPGFGTGIDLGHSLEPALGQSLLGGLGWLAWPCLIAGMFWTLSRIARDNRSWAAGLHSAAFWVVALWFAALVAQQTRWVEGLGASWVQAATGCAFIAVAAVAYFVMRRIRAEDLRQVYALPCLGGLVCRIAIWQLRTNFLAAGLPHPLPYLPLLNPVDVSLGLAFLCCVAWVRNQFPKLIPGLLGMAFLWINGMLARSVQHYTGIAWSEEALLGSNSMQMAISVSWTLLGLCTVLWASRYRDRIIWFVGCGLLGVVVGKLFLHDIAHQGTVTKIVTFLVVGVLLLVVGYFSPMPPASSQPNSSNADPEVKDRSPHQNEPGGNES